MAAERDADTALLQLGEVIGLADIIERIELDHQVVKAVDAGLDRGEAVMAAVEMKEERLERALRVVAEAEAEQVDVKGQHRVERSDGENDVTEPKRSGAKAAERAAGDEGGGRCGGAVEEFEAIACGIMRDDQLGDTALLGLERRTWDDRMAGVGQPRRQPRQGRAIGDFPAHRADALA